MARIVVVDDDADIRFLVQMKLTSLGHEVHPACDGVEGLDLCRTVAPALAVLDVNMPGMTGLEVLTELRSREETRDLPVMLLSAMSTPADIAAGTDAGADDYVTKPFSPALLAARVGALLGVEDDLVS